MELKPVKSELNPDDLVYSKSDILKYYSEIHNFEDDILGINVREELHVDFALFDWSYEDESGSYYHRIFHGSGPSGSLREPRHIYWGDEQGYTFFLPLSSVIKAFDVLKKYFDFS